MFKEIRKQIKDIESGASKLKQSFEGEFFSASPWFLSNLDLEGFSELKKIQVGPVSDVAQELESKPSIDKVIVKELAKVLVKKDSKPQEVNTKTREDSNPGNFSAAYQALGPGFASKKKVNTGKLETTVAFCSDISKHINEVNLKEIEYSSISGMKSVNLDTGIKVLFVGESNVENIGETLEAHLHSDSNKSDLLGKMIGAMQLVSGDFVRTALVEYDGSDEEAIQRNLNNICQEISLLKPQLVITLGAVSTNLLLGKKERLSQIHGEFFTRQYSFTTGEEFDFKMIPIFHPDFLEINPSMKRTAWLDLQKVMELLEIPLK